MKNELLTIGPLTVYGYGAMIALGVIAAWVVTELRAKKLRLSSDHVFALALWGFWAVCSVRNFCTGSQNGNPSWQIRDLFWTHCRMDL